MLTILGHVFLIVLRMSQSFFFNSAISHAAILALPHLIQ